MCIWGTVFQARGSKCKGPEAGVPIPGRPVQWEHRGGEGVSGMMGHRLSMLCGPLRGLWLFPHGNGGTVEQRKARVD